MKTETLKRPWVRAAYALFARQGPSALKVEVLARKVHKSKSSFYHHFADMDVFREELFAHHLQRARIMGEKEAACEQLDPDLIMVIVEFKEDLLFNRQLRVHRDQPEFRACFEKANEIVGDAILDIWAQALNLDDQTYLAKMVLALTMENFFLQITEESLTYKWMRAYFQNIRFMVSQFKQQAAASS